MTNSLDPREVFELAKKEILDELARNGRVVGSDQAVIGRLETERDNLRREVTQVQSKLQQAEATGKVSTDQLKAATTVLERLKKASKQLATVLKVGKEKTVISVTGKPVEVENVDKVKAGDTVRVVGDTMQIDSVADEAPIAGEVCVVNFVGKNNLAEIERAGTARAIAFSDDMKVEEGDRVVLDMTGSVVIANLGKPRASNVLSAPTGVTWDDVGGLEEAKRALQDAIEGPVRNAEKFRRYGKKPARGVLLYGPPGCGKTYLGKAAATANAEIHGKGNVGGFLYVKGPELLNMFVGNTEQKIRDLFASARRHKKEHGFPAVIFIDEADSIMGKRGERGFGLEKTIVPQFLAEMDGLDETGALVLIATNLPRTLDPAIVRDGRIDRRIKVGRPTEADARMIFAKHLATGKPLAGSIEEFAEAAAHAMYDPSRVLYRVKKHSSVGEGVPLTFGHVANGALIAGIVERATTAAMHADVDVGIEHLVAAVGEAMREMLDVNMDDELAEFCDGWQHEVEKITKVAHNRRPVTAPVDRSVS